jgi:hypothetical protein
MKYLEKQNSPSLKMEVLGIGEKRRQKSLVTE